MTKIEAFNLLTNHGVDTQAVEFLAWQQYLTAVRDDAQQTEEHF